MGMFRNLFDKLNQEPTRTQSRVEYVEYSSSPMMNSNMDIYKSEIARSAIHTIANNASKLKGKHIRKKNGEIKEGDADLNYLLQVRPNPRMSAASMIYKSVTQMYVQGDSFIHIVRDMMGRPIELMPIDYTTFKVYTEGEYVYIQFQDGNRNQFIYDYQDVIHLRRHFNKGSVKSEEPISAFGNVLDASNTMIQGLTNATKNSARIRGILIHEGTMKEKDLKARSDAFKTEYMNLENSGGIAALDGKATYQELKPDYKNFDSEQMEYIKEMMYSFFNVNDDIVQSKYSEENWDAFYESVLETIGLQYSLECTHKFFSNREKGHGNEIYFEANRLAYVSTKTKIQLVKETAPLGIFTINEVRTEIFNMAPIEGGDVRLQTLNVVQADKANKYQLGEEDEEDDKQG